MKRTGIVSIIILLALFANTPASALTRFENTRPAGVYLSLGLATGSAHVHYPHFDRFNDSKSSMSLNFRAGLAIHRRLLLGYEYNSWHRQQVGRNYYYDHYALVATYYVTKEMYVKAGPAFGAATFDIEEDCNHRISEMTGGAGLVVGVGADVRISRSFSFVPAVQYLYAGFDDFSASFISLVFGIGWFW